MEKENYLADSSWTPLLHRKRRWEFVPRRAALLTLDMQLYFLSPASHAWVPGGAEIIGPIGALQDVFRRREAPVFQTRHLNDPTNAGMMARQWRELLGRDNPLSAITPELTHPEIPVVEKAQYDAFYNTDLESRLHAADVTAVVICGLMTHLCCESTARSAFIRGFGVIFAADAAAAYHRDYHNGTLRNLAHGFATVLPYREILELMTGEKGGSVS